MNLDKLRKNIWYSIVAVMGIVIVSIFCCSFTIYILKVTPNLPNLFPAFQPTQTPDPIQTYLDEYGGDPEVYRRIFTLNDCNKLEEEYNHAQADFQTQQQFWSLGYIGATLDRGREIGCFE